MAGEQWWESSDGGAVVGEQWWESSGGEQWWGSSDGEAVVGESSGGEAVVEEGAGGAEPPPHTAAAIELISSELTEWQALV